MTDWRRRGASVTNVQYAGRGVMQRLPWKFEEGGGTNRRRATMTRIMMTRQILPRDRLVKARLPRPDQAHFSRDAKLPPSGRIIGVDTWHKSVRPTIPSWRSTSQRGVRGKDDPNLLLTDRLSDDANAPFSPSPSRRHSGDDVPPSSVGRLPATLHPRRRIVVVPTAAGSGIVRCGRIAVPRQHGPRTPRQDERHDHPPSSSSSSSSSLSSSPLSP
jgi:hypothetical protein